MTRSCLGTTRWKNTMLTSGELGILRSYFLSSSFHFAFRSLSGKTSTFECLVDAVKMFSLDICAVVCSYCVAGVANADAAPVLLLTVGQVHKSLGDVGFRDNCYGIAFDLVTRNIYVSDYRHVYVLANDGQFLRK